MSSQTHSQNSLLHNTQQTFKIIVVTVAAAVVCGGGVAFVRVGWNALSMKRSTCSDPSIFAWTNPVDPNTPSPRNLVIGLRLKSDVNIKEVDVYSQKEGRISLGRAGGYLPNQTVVLLPDGDKETGQQGDIPSSLGPTYLDPMTGGFGREKYTLDEVQKYKSYYNWPASDQLTVKYQFKHDSCPNFTDGSFTFRTGVTHE